MAKSNTLAKVAEKLKANDGVYVIHEGLPDCQLWLKHAELSIVLAVLAGALDAPSFPDAARSTLREIANKLSMQWLKYEDATGEAVPSVPHDNV